jgi:hypothetical protein
MSDRIVQCGECQQFLDELPNDPNRTPCPTCGSTRRAFNVSANIEFTIMEGYGLKIKDPSFRGKRRIKYEEKGGYKLHRKSNKWNKYVQVIDRENDRYLEIATDRVTGEVLHHCEEPLSEHFGHGSDKKEVRQNNTSTFSLNTSDFQSSSSSEWTSYFGEPPKPPAT